MAVLQYTLSCHVHLPRPLPCFSALVFAGIPLAATDIIIPGQMRTVIEAFPQRALMESMSACSLVEDLQRGER